MAFAEDEDFGDAAGVFVTLSEGLNLVQIVGIDERGIAINLNFSFRKFQFDELAAVFCELR